VAASDLFPRGIVVELLTRNPEDFVRARPARDAVVTQAPLGPLDRLQILEDSGAVATETMTMVIVIELHDQPGVHVLHATPQRDPGSRNAEQRSMLRLTA